MTAVIPARRMNSWWGLRIQESHTLYTDGKNTGYFFRYRAFDRMERVKEGFACARQGGVDEPKIEASRLSAAVYTDPQNGVAHPWIEVAPIPDKVWSLIFTGMAQRAQLLAELLCGNLPVDLREVFHDAGTDLFPRTEKDLVGGCDCDTEVPCAHLFALHYILADACEQDPFLLLELRGCPRDKLISGVHAARRGGPLEPAGVSISGVDPSTYETLQARLPDILDPPEVPDNPGDWLKDLRAPEGWEEQALPATFLAPAVAAAASHAGLLLRSPARILTLAPKPPLVDARIERARRLLEPARAALVLPALSVLLLRERSTTEDLDELLTSFSGLLARPRERLERWWKRWVPGILLPCQRTSAAVAVFGISSELEATVVLSVGHRSGILRWRIGPLQTAERARIRARRLLLEQINELIPQEVEIEIHASARELGDGLDEYVDALGWTLLPQVDSNLLDALKESIGGREDWRPTPTQANHLLQFHSIALALDRLLAEACASSSRAGTAAEFSASNQSFSSLSNAKDAPFHKTLRTFAERLAAHPILAHFFASS